MIQIQFPGYQAETYTLPLTKSPFEHISSVDEANEIIENTLMGDEDAGGWCAGNASGEDFQVRQATAYPVRVGREESTGVLIAHACQPAEYRLLTIQGGKQ